MLKADFFSALNQCLTIDRPRFIGRWQRLRQLENEKLAAATQQLKAQIQQSQQHAQRRQQVIPVLPLNDDLPVSQRAEEIINAIKNHQVIVLAVKQVQEKRLNYLNYV